MQTHVYVIRSLCLTPSHKAAHLPISSISGLFLMRQQKGDWKAGGHWASERGEATNQRKASQCSALASFAPFPGLSASQLFRYKLWPLLLHLLLGLQPPLKENKDKAFLGTLRVFNLLQPSAEHRTVTDYGMILFKIRSEGIFPSSFIVCLDSSVI